MPRPDLSSQRRLEFAPILAKTFAELGYRRTTTSALAEACGVQETILYRLWSDKQTMFLAALDHVYDLSERTWATLLSDTEDKYSQAQRILRYEADHHGEFGFYRILFAGLSETDDAEIRKGLRRLYRKFLSFIEGKVASHRGDREGANEIHAELLAWAILGLGTVSSIGRELGLLSLAKRRSLFLDVGGKFLLDGAGTDPASPSK